MSIVPEPVRVTHPVKENWIVTTGELTIYSVNISDEGFYYYQFYIDGGPADTGYKYETEIEVYGKLREIIYHRKLIHLHAEICWEY